MRALCATAALTVGCVGAQALGASIYATTGDEVIRIDVDAPGGPTATVVFDGLFVFSLAGGAADDRLYLLESSTGDIWDLDLTTSVATPAGAVFIGGNSFGEGMDGSWYANHTNAFSLDRFDPTSPAPPTYLGNGTSGAGYSGDMAADNSGTLYGATGDGIVIIDKTDGSHTFLPGSIPGMWGLAFTKDGRLFGASGGGDIYQINTVTGAGTLIGNVGSSIIDLGSERGVIPAPGAGVLLACAGLLSVRRRR